MPTITYSILFRHSDLRSCFPNILCTFLLPCLCLHYFFHLSPSIYHTQTSISHHQNTILPPGPIPNCEACPDTPTLMCTLLLNPSMAPVISLFLHWFILLGPAVTFVLLMPTIRVLPPLQERAHLYITSSTLSLYSEFNKYLWHLINSSKTINQVAHVKFKTMS